MTNRALLRVIERMERAHAAERARLLDTICHLAGSPWTPSPASMVEEPDTDDPDLGRFVALPEHLPDDE